MSDCLFCERECPRCRYEIPGNFEHIEQPQAEGSNVVVCTLRRLQRPLVEMIAGYLEHENEHVKRTRAEWAAMEDKA